MELEGCGCSGFSYTNKYKKAIVTIFDWVMQKNLEDEMSYSIFQNELSNQKISDESEIRMIIPFLVKVGIINNSNCIRGGSRIKKMVINENFFTLYGKLFIQFLKIELNNQFLTNEENNIIKQVYQKFGFIQFYSLMHSDDSIYQDLYDFLKTYKHMDKNEFFILTTCRKYNKMSDLHELVNNYRENKIDNIVIKNNVNAFTYISRLLLQLGVVFFENESLYFTDNYKKMEMEYYGD